MPVLIGLFSAPSSPYPAVRTWLCAGAATNVLRHAGPQAHARLEIRVTGRQVRVRISNIHCGPQAPHGFGLTSLKSQVAQSGGTFTAGVHGRHWRVQAHLPLSDNKEDTVTNR